MPPALPQKAKSYLQKFRKDWQKDPLFSAWLQPVEGDDSLAKCKFCVKTFAARLQSVKIHLKSEVHAQHERDRGLASRTAQRMEEFVAQGTNDKLKQKKETELRMAVFLAEHTSFRTAPHLSSLIGNVSDHVPRLGRIKASAMVKNVLAPSYRDDLLSEVRGKPFSLIIDEATDVSVQKTLGIIIRYTDFDKGKVVDTFYRLLPVLRGDAESIANAIKSALAEDELDVQWLVGLGVDGASAMVGCHRSVKTLMQDVVPHLTTIRCVSHSLAKVNF